ncbi:MAG: hypothetical protein ABJL44_09935 [Algibacter sp.]
MRKTIILIFGVIILQLNFSCKSQYSVTELDNNFTTEQISDLNKITSFFKNQVCLNTNADFKKCYRQIPHEYLEATGSGFWDSITFEKQQELYREISESTFNEIWCLCRAELKNICAITKGKYQKYLTELGKTNPVIAKYAKNILASGIFDFGKVIHYSNVINDKKHFDLNDPNIQLILAIHYLSKDKLITE